MIQGWRTYSRTYVRLGLLAVLLYVPGCWWGAPHATAPDRKGSWGVDDETPLGPLAELQNMVAPSPDRNLGYPLLYSYLVSTAYAPYLAYLWTTGQLSAPSPTYPFGLADPVTGLRVLTWIAHAVSVLMGAGIVLAALDIGRTLWGARSGVLAGLFAMVSYPMFYYTRTGNVDVPTSCLLALALAVSARILMGGVTHRRGVWLGVFAGLAVATKETSLAFLVGLPPMLLAALLRENDGARRRGFARSATLALLAGGLAFGAGSGLFLDPHRYLAHVAFVRGRLATLASDQVAFLAAAPFTWEGHWQLVVATLKDLSVAATLPGLALSALGALWTLRREPATTLVVVPAVTNAAVLFWFARAVQLRYLMPVSFVLSLFAGRAAAAAWGVRRPVLRAAIGGLLALALAVGFLRGIDLTYAMINDSRFVAGAWLQAQARGGDRLAYFGDPASLPPLDAAMTTRRTMPYTGALYRYPTDDQTVGTIVAQWAEEKPRFVLLMPDTSSRAGEPHNITCPPEIYRRLLDGRLGYRLAAQFETAPLFPWVRRPELDYPSVSPPIRIFERVEEPGRQETR